MKRIRRFSKRTWVLVGVVAVIAAMASMGAYAYFTASGSGTGTATVGTSTDFVLHGSVADPLYPGTSETVGLTVDNPGSGNQYLDTIHLESIDACDDVFVSGACSGDPIPGCGSIDEDLGSGNAGTGDFFMEDVVVAYDYSPGAGQSAPDGLLVMNDLDTSQDACKNAYLQLNLSSN
jgi:hypothetical protein